MSLKWIANKKPNPHAVFRCFAFPCAGAGASFFRKWAAFIPEGIDFLAVQLPGRETRFSEPGCVSMDNLLPKLHHGLAPFFDKPFMFFGHSLGALLGFELARRLQAHGGPMPRHLLAAAFRAPRLPSGHPDLHGLSNPEFIEAFIRFEGIPKEIAQHKELLELLAITAKKDFQIHETWVYQPGSPLVCPITAFGGQDDPFVRPEMLDDWGHETSANFRKQLFSGGHHFVQEHIAPIIQEIKACAAALAG